MHAELKLIHVIKSGHNKTIGYTRLFDILHKDSNSYKNMQHFCAMTDYNLSVRHNNIDNSKGQIWANLINPIFKATVNSICFI